jgi:hypothetical protein
MVPSMSAVSVLVIDCTTIGAPPPTATSPTLTWVVRCRGAGPAMSESMGFSSLFMGSKYQVLVTLSNASRGAAAVELGRLTRKSPAITRIAAAPNVRLKVSCMMK